MDVNNTRYHMLVGKRDWQPVIRQTLLDGTAPIEWRTTRADDRAIFWDDDFGGITLLRQLPLLGGIHGTAPADVSTRSATVDGFGNVFWISEDGASIWAQPKGLSSSGVFWNTSDLCIPPPQRASLFGPLDPPATPPTAPLLSGLAVTSHRYMLAGTSQPEPGLMVLDLDAGGSPVFLKVTSDPPFRPWLLAPTFAGGVAVLDFDTDRTSARLWQLDRAFTNVSSMGPGLRIDMVAPAGLASLPDGSVLVLDAGPSGTPARILRADAARVINSIALDTALTSPELSIAITEARSFAVTVSSDSTTDTISGSVYIATGAYPQAFELDFIAAGDSLSLTVNPRTLPLSGVTTPTLVTSGADVLFRGGDQWFTLEEQPRYRYYPSAVLANGESPEDSAMVFDGKQPDCVWHRLFLDACIPSGCEVRVRTRAADEMDRLEAAAWTEQPPPRIRPDGSELPFQRPFADAADNEHLGTFETLIASTEGRYLQLELTLVSDGRASPKIRAVRIYYPRFSYLREYLPAIYREDQVAADFLDRWLANTEGLLTTIEDRIANAQITLDPATAPAEYLDWLAGWVDALLDPEWDDGRRRLFLKFAWLLYKWRGSSRGLLSFLRLATEDCPDESLFAPLLNDCGCSQEPNAGFGLRVVESFELRQFSAALLGDPTTAAPAFATSTSSWQVSDGGSRLNSLFRDWLLCRYGPIPTGTQPVNWQQFASRLSAAWGVVFQTTDASDVRFSPVPPSNATELADWEAFSAATFNSGYPEVLPSDLGDWQEFLARRYTTIDALNRAHSRTGTAAWSGFGSVPLPAEHELPPDGTSFVDWWQFATIALPIRRNAHRFTVLVPAYEGEDPTARSDRLLRVSQIVESEKPAHTSFEARLFWALFQVGTARVGIDTVLGESSRFLPMVLDAGYLRDSYLAAGHPWDATDRQIIGRDRLKRNDTWISTTAAHSRTH
jgi:phage tail-like protein